MMEAEKMKKRQKLMNATSKKELQWEEAKSARNKKNS